MLFATVLIDSDSTYT